MTKEEIWERLETEFKLRGYSQKSIGTYKAGITTFLDWANKPYEDLDEEDFRNYLIHIIQEGRLKPQTINSKNSAIRFFLVVILGKNVNPMRTARLRGVLNLPNVWCKETVERFFSVIDNPRDMAIFMNIYGSGLRISEICRLKVEDTRGFHLPSTYTVEEVRAVENSIDRTTSIGKRDYAMQLCST